MILIIDSLNIDTFLISGVPKPKLKWWSDSKRLSKMIKNAKATLSAYPVVKTDQKRMPKTTSVLEIKSLQREDHLAKVGCIATNTNLTKPPENSFKINLICKLLDLLF